MDSALLDGGAEPIRPGDRVVFTAGEIVGDIGHVAQFLPHYAEMMGEDVWLVITEDSESYPVALSALARSPYQNEKLEWVPNV